jgi:hypothetical protein
MKYYIHLIILLLAGNIYSSAEERVTQFSVKDKHRLISNCVAGFIDRAQDILPGGLPDHMKQAYALCPQVVEILCQRVERKIQNPVQHKQLFQLFHQEEELMKKEVYGAGFGKFS